MTKLRTAALALSLFAAGCMPESPTGVVYDPHGHAPSTLRPYLGAIYDVSIEYHGVKARNTGAALKNEGQVCHLEAMPFTAPGEDPAFGVAIDMFVHLGVDYMNGNPVLVSVHPETRATALENGRLDIDTRSGRFTFASSHTDTHAKATHSYAFEGAFADAGEPAYLFLDGRYSRSDRAGRACDVYFTIKGPRVGDL